MSIIYISEFSKENLKIGEKIRIRNPDSVCLFWKTIESEKSKEDYESVFENSMRSNFYVICHEIDNLNFVESIYSFIKSRDLLPSDIIVRGKLYEIWPLAVMKSLLYVESKCHLILDDAERTRPLEPFEKFCLDSFDLIYSMGPSSNFLEYSYKTEIFFSQIDSSKFKFLPPYLIELPEVVTPTIFCNSINIGEISEIVNKTGIQASIINIDNTSELDLCLFGLISNNIIDQSNNVEFSLAMSKIGKKGILFKDFVNDDRLFFGSWDKNIEDFSNKLVNIVFEKIDSEEGKGIIGFEVS